MGGCTIVGLYFLKKPWEPISICSCSCKLLDISLRKIRIMKAHKVSKIEIEEYLLLESAAQFKSEYHDGKLFALAGGTINHGRLCGNIYSEIRSALSAKNSKNEPFASELRLRIEKKNAFVYPDAMVVCGDLNISSNDKNSITNPILVIEVLSKSTSDYDRGEKFYLYRQIPSLQEYVLIEQDKKIVEVYYKKKGTDLWSISRFDLNSAIVSFRSVDIELSLDVIYANVL